MIITLSLKNPPHLGELYAQPGRDVLGLQPSGHGDSKIRPEGVDHLTRLVVLLNGPVTLLAGRAVLRAKSFFSSAQLVQLPMQPGDHLGVPVRPLL